MSELLWTLSLVAQKHLAQAPTVSPSLDLNGVDAEMAIARQNGVNLVQGMEGTPVESVSPEFSALPPQVMPSDTAYKMGDRSIAPANSPSMLEKTPKAIPPIDSADLASTYFQVPSMVSSTMPFPEFLETGSSPSVRPMSGSQLYAQRLEALRNGQTYTRLPPNSFQNVWQDTTYHPQYEDWLALLKREADAMAWGQGSNRLTVILGDSLSQWFPNDQLPHDRFWLNQGISGDTSAGVLRRLSLFDGTNPDVIYVMVGINDLRAGATDAEVLSNLQQIMHELRQRHPDAQVYVYSLLPTRLPTIPNERITALNQAIAQITQRKNVAYLDLQTTFADDEGNLRLDLTTDGLHLSRSGYAMWQSALRWFQLT